MNRGGKFDIERCSNEQNVFVKTDTKAEMELALALRDVTMNIIKDHVLSPKEKFVYEAVNELRMKHEEVAIKLNTTANDSKQTLYRANLKIRKVCNSLK